MSFTTQDVASLQGRHSCQNSDAYARGREAAETGKAPETNDEGSCSGEALALSIEELPPPVLVGGIPHFFVCNALLARSEGPNILSII